MIMWMFRVVGVKAPAVEQVKPNECCFFWWSVCHKKRKWRKRMWMWCNEGDWNKITIHKLAKWKDIGWKEQNFSDIPDTWEDIVCCDFFSQSRYFPPSTICICFFLCQAILVHMSYSPGGIFPLDMYIMVYTYKKYFKNIMQQHNEPQPWWSNNVVIKYQQKWNLQYLVNNGDPIFVTAPTSEFHKNN